MTLARALTLAARLLKALKTLRIAFIGDVLLVVMDRDGKSLDPVPVAWP
jgi:hypothetical protein